MNHSSENNSEIQFSPAMIQKLVDGELEHQVRSQLLSSLESDSPVWRKIALAFVENQVFAEALRCPLEQKASRPVEEASEAQHGNRRLTVWLAGLAACLMLGFFVGFVLKAKTPPRYSQARFDAVPSVNQGNAEAGDASNLALADALSRSVVPVPDEFRRALRKAGYSIQDKQTITNVDLPSGGQIELPIRRVNVTFVGLSSFQ